MSIKDQDLVDRLYSLVSQSGLDRGYKCTNDPASYVLALTQRQARPTKSGGLMSVLTQATVTWQDPVTGEVFVATANITLKVKNSMPVANAKIAAQYALTGVVRQILPAVDATSNTALKAVSDNLLLGVLPTP